jgi:alpha-mannosidase
VYRKKEIDCSRFSKMLDEIMPYCVTRIEKLIWIHKGEMIRLPYRWKGGNEPAIFESVFQQNLLESFHKCYLRAWFGGESLIKVDGLTLGEINEYHREINLTQFCDGKEHKLTVETMPRGLFGTKSEPLFTEGYLICYDADMLRAVRFFKKLSTWFKKHMTKDYQH